jgi:hypothetical protein
LVCFADSYSWHAQGIHLAAAEVLPSYRQPDALELPIQGLHDMTANRHYNPAGGAAASGKKVVVALGVSLCITKGRGVLKITDVRERGKIWTFGGARSKM